MLIDTHAHLNFRDYQKDLNQVIKRSIENGVTKIICVSSNIGDSQKAIEIAHKCPGMVYAAVGIHPQQTDPENKTSLKKQIEQLGELAKQKKVVAIGECGLDYSPAPPSEKDRSQKNQYLLFKKQLELAQKQRLPIIIHTRKAFNDTIQIIKSCISPNPSALSGVFHCYSAGKKGLKSVQELGFYFGFDGNLTYDEGLGNTTKEIPLEKIILETDSPYLSPEPFRGQKNEPKNVKIIAEFLAKLKGIPYEKVAKATTQNAKKLFKTLT